MVLAVHKILIWSDETATQNRTVSKVEKTKGQWKNKEDSQQKYLGPVISKTLVGINPDFIDVHTSPLILTVPATGRYIYLE